MLIIAPHQVRWQRRPQLAPTTLTCSARLGSRAARQRRCADMQPNTVSEVVSLGIPGVQGCQLMGLRMPMTQRMTQMILQIVWSDFGTTRDTVQYCPQAAKQVRRLRNSSHEIRRQHGGPCCIERACCFWCEGVAPEKRMSTEKRTDTNDKSHIDAKSSAGHMKLCLVCAARN